MIRITIDTFAIRWITAVFAQYLVITWVQRSAYRSDLLERTEDLSMDGRILKIIPKRMNRRFTAFYKRQDFKERKLNLHIPSSNCNLLIYIPSPNQL